MAEPFGEPVLLERVHEEAHRAPVHAEYRDPELHVPMQRIEHEPVPPEGHDDVRVLDGMLSVAPDELPDGVPGMVRSEERDALSRHRPRQSACTG